MLAVHPITGRWRCTASTSRSAIPPRGPSPRSRSTARRPGTATPCGCPTSWRTVSIAPTATTRSERWVFGAEEALTAGRVSELHPRAELLKRAHELAHELAANTAPVSVAITRQLLYRMSAHDSPHDTERLHSRLIADLLATPDAAE